jgi:cation diffusion facilitator family transporter
MTDSDRAQQTSRRGVEPARGGQESRKTVLVALVANGLIALAKLVGGLMSGSTALLAEAAHSLADTVNQGFLLASIALAGREPNERQPFGYGQQRFLWTFLAAVCMFVAGATFAIGYGIAQLIKGGESSGGYAVAWITLAIALAAEGTSFVRALRQTRGEAREAGKPLRRYLRESRDPSVKMVVFEDSAALAGIVIAAAGIGLDQATGASIWDPVASIVIGVLLVAVAVWMARDSGHLLLGASARPEERQEIERVLEASPAVVRVKELLTMVLGPSALLVAARVDLRDEHTADDWERAASALDRELRSAIPDVTEVFLDATPG